MFIIPNPCSNFIFLFSTFTLQYNPYIPPIARKAVDTKVKIENISNGSFLTKEKIINCEKFPTLPTKYKMKQHIQINLNRRKCLETKDDWDKDVRIVEFIS